MTHKFYSCAWLNGEGGKTGLSQFLHQLLFAIISLFLVLTPKLVSAQQAAAVKDPTIPPLAWQAVMPGNKGDTAVNDQDSSRVQVVVVGKSRRIALVDGKVVQPGDELIGEKVVDVNSKGVFLESEGKSLEMTPYVEKMAPAQAAVKKKLVVIPEDGSSSKQLGSKQ